MSRWVIAVMAACLGAASLMGRAAVLPLQPTRTIRFATDEGTWMSLDVSPDGQTIVFDLLGDLYTLPIGGGEATRITHGMSFDSQPRFSPDGRTLVFVSDRDGAENLWLADADGGNPRSLTRDKRDMFVSPAWTPDGESIVVTKSIGGSGIWGWGNAPLPLYVYHRDGGTGVQLTRVPPAIDALDDNSLRYTGAAATRYLGVAFSKDSRRMLASVSSPAMTGGGWQIVSVDRESGEPVILTQEVGGAMRPTLSPDGRYVVYATRESSQTSLRIRDMRSGETHMLLRGVTRDGQRDPDMSRDLMPGAAFTPDGHALIVSYGGKLWRLEILTGRTSPIPFTALVEQALGPSLHFNYAMDDSMLRVRQIRDARPSPDGRRLVFSALDRIWITDLPDGHPVRLTENTTGEFFPVWSPDGRYIAYVTWSDQNGGFLWRAHSDGKGAPQRLTQVPAYYEKLTYSPDGQTLWASRSPYQAHLEARSEVNRDQSRSTLNTELIRLPAGGGDIDAVMPLNTAKAYEPTFYGTPHFSRESGRIYLYSNDDGLVSVDIHGHDRRSILKVTGWSTDHAGQVPAEDVVLSPDGARALALVNQNVYLIDMPSVSVPETPVVSVDRGISPLPLRRLSSVGGDFIGWSQDGARLYYSFGSSFFSCAIDGDGRCDPSAAAHPQEHNVNLVVARDRPLGALLLRGARLVTMKAEEVVEDGDLLIQNNRIRAVGRRGQFPIPKDAQIFDVAGRTIIPGLIDVHAHLSPAWGVHRSQPWEYSTSLAYGVTSIRDPQAGVSDVLTYGDVADAGGMLGPRVFSTGRGLFQENDLQSLDAARNVLRRYSRFFDTHSIKQYLIGGRVERQWIAMAAREQKLTATNEGGVDFKMNLTLVLDGYSGLEHGIRTFPLYRDVTELMARSGIIYTLTSQSSVTGEPDYFYRNYPVHDDAKLKRFVPHLELDALPFRGRSTVVDDPYVFASRAASASRIIASGGKVALGSHGEFPGMGVHWELWANQMGGMTPHQALQVATLSGAEALGLGAEVGSLEKGKLADLVVLEGNPLLDIHQSTSIQYVMKNGRLYSGDSLAEVWPRSRPFK